MTLAEKLPIDDLDRIAFLSGASDRVANALMTTRPVQGSELGAAAWRSSMAIKFARPDPLCAAVVGRSFKPNGRAAPIVVDEFGHKLKAIPAAKGGHATWHHNRLVDTLVGIVREATITCAGGTGNPLLNFFSAEQEMRPDIYIDPSSFKFEATVAPAEEQLQTLYDLKTASYGDNYKQAPPADTRIHFGQYGPFSTTANTRQRQVPRNYFGRAKRKDEEKGNTAIMDQLLQYGKNGEVIGLVFGAFFEVSDGVHKLIDLAARANATKILNSKQGKEDAGIVLSICRRRLYSRVAIASARSWAIFLRDRIRFFFGAMAVPQGAV